MLSRYNERLAAVGPTREALAVGPQARHDLRFAALTEVGIRAGDTVLDIGCGLGDFLGFLQARSMEVRYIGVDLNPQLIAHARARHPDAEFLVADAIEDPLPEADWVVSSTAFNLRLTSMDNRALAQHVLERAFRVARRGVAIDFLSRFAEFQHPDAYHYDPLELFAYAKTLTKRVVLRHDYPLFEFMLYLYPDFAGWTRA
jgi:ubiquinone/menaquinone biosynthesis C-methylase UbiE